MYSFYNTLQTSFWQGWKALCHQLTFLLHSSPIFCSFMSTKPSQKRFLWDPLCILSPHHEPLFLILISHFYFPSLNWLLIYQKILFVSHDSIVQIPCYGKSIHSSVLAILSMSHELWFIKRAIISLWHSPPSSSKSNVLLYFSHSNFNRGSTKLTGKRSDW